MLITLPFLQSLLEKISASYAAVDLNKNLNEELYLTY